MARWTSVLTGLAAAALLVGGCSGDDADTTGAASRTESAAAAEPSTSGQGTLESPGTTTEAEASQPAPAEGSAAAEDVAPAEQVLVCTFTVEEIEGIVPAGAQPAEDLRTAVLVLSDKVSELRGASDGLESAERVIAPLEQTLADWEEGLAAYDSGDDDAGARAVEQGAERLEALEDDLADERLQGC